MSRKKLVIMLSIALSIVPISIISTTSAHAMVATVSDGGGGHGPGTTMSGFERCP